MNKYILVLMASLYTIVSFANDENYYSLHPVALQKAIEKCPERSPRQVTCSQLKNIALHINDLAYELRIDPQGYGKKILTLQEMIAKQQRAVIKPGVSLALNESKQELQERLAIVKWLESPES